MRHRPTRSRAARPSRAAALAVLALAACDGPTEAGPTAAGTCRSGVALTVTGGVEPTVTWTPACSADYLDVEDVGVDADIRAGADRAPRLKERLGGVQPVRASLLQAGRRYQFRLVTSACREPGIASCSARTIGQADYVP